jgi:hypothetical protein
VYEFCVPSIVTVNVDILDVVLLLTEKIMTKIVDVVLFGVDVEEEGEVD